MIQKIIISICLLVIIFGIEEEFIFTQSEAAVINVDASQNIGALSDIFSPGLMGSWNDSYIPISSETRNLNKKPFFRLHLGIGWDESPVKLGDFDIKFQNWLRYTVDPNIKKYQDAGYQTVISLTEMPKWLSSYPDDECMPSGDGCRKKWQFSPPNDYAEWEKLLQLLVTTQQQDGIKADYIIWDEPNWMFYGTEEQYWEMYKHSVWAIKGIDGNIKVGALGAGCWACTKDTNCPAQITGLPDGECPVADHTMIMGQIKYVSDYNVPMDFIDWHFPDLNYFKYEVDTTRDMLTIYGLDSTLPLTIGEWVFSSAKEYESTEIGAANVICTLKTLLDNGIYRHSATSIYDQSIWPSGAWAHVGFFSEEGVIKAKWNSFKAIDRLPSQRLSVSNDSEDLVTTVAANDSTKIAVVMSNSTDSQQVTLGVNNLASGSYTVRKYLIDGDMNVIHSNPCRYNKKTELVKSNTDCGVNGAIDRAVANARKEAENVTKDYLVSAGIPLQHANNIIACYSDPGCSKPKYIKSYCQKNTRTCIANILSLVEAQSLYNDLFYYGQYYAKSGKIYKISDYIDKINNLKEVSLEGSRQEKQITVTNGTYTEVVNMLPYSVILIELLLK